MPGEPLLISKASSNLPWDPRVTGVWERWSRRKEGRGGMGYQEGEGQAEQAGLSANEWDPRFSHAQEQWPSDGVPSLSIQGAALQETEIPRRPTAVFMRVYY